MFRNEYQSLDEVYRQKHINIPYREGMQALCLYVGAKKAYYPCKCIPRCYSCRKLPNLNVVLLQVYVDGNASLIHPSKATYRIFLYNYDTRGENYYKIEDGLPKELTISTTIDEEKNLYKSILKPISEVLSCDYYPQDGFRGKKGRESYVNQFKTLFMKVVSNETERDPGEAPHVKSRHKGTSHVRV